MANPLSDVNVYPVAIRSFDGYLIKISSVMMKRLFSTALIALALTAATAPAVLAQGIGDTTKIKSNKKSAKVKTTNGKTKIDKKANKAKLKGDAVDQVTPN